MITKEMDFFIFLLENYAISKQTSSDRVFADWEKHHLIDRIYDMYERYHCEALENAFDDIDEMMSEEQE